MRNTWQEDIAQHSLQVAMIAHALAIYKNERFDELNALQKVEFDEATRLEYFEEMKAIIAEEVPSCAGFFSPITCVVNKDLNNTYAAMANMLYRFEWFSW